LPIDAGIGDAGRSRLGTPGRLVTDGVMGGVSAVRISRETSDGRRALCLHGDVSPEHNGGLVPVGLDPATQGYLDASAYTRLRGRASAG
jgi:hypothetical protein